jgi:iron(III) transport system permease protein
MLTGNGKAGKYIPTLLFILICAFFLAFFIYPLLLAVKEGLLHKGEFSLYWVMGIVKNKILLQKFINSLLLASISTLLIICFSLPLAMISANCSFKGRDIAANLLLLPMIMPPFVGALSVKRFFAQYGTLNQILINTGAIEFSQAYDWLGSGFAAVVLMQMLHLFPIMYLNLTSCLSNIDPMYYEAAKNFGACGWKQFWKITLPLLRPGIFAGSSIVFIWSFTDIGTPLIFDYNELASVQVFNELKQSNISGSAYGFVIVLLLVSVACYSLTKVVLGKPVASDTSKATVSAQSRPLSGFKTLLVWLLFGSVTLVAIMPHLGVIVTAFADRWVNTIVPETWTVSHMKFVLTQQQTRTSIINSLKYASCSTLLDIVIGTTAAWLIIRRKHFGSRALDSMLMMPLAVPGLILAAGFIAMTVMGSRFESIGPAYNPFIIIVIAYAVRRIPFVVRGVSAGLQQIPVTLEHAAMNLGASRFTAFKRITMPLISANIIAAGVLTFAFAMLEVSDSLVLAQQAAHYPITKQMYVSVAANPDAVNIASALGVVGMVLLGSSMFAASMLMGRKLGAIFRV